MTRPTIPAKSFLKAMALPAKQRRKVLESLGAEMMDRVRAERQSPRGPSLPRKYFSKRV